MAQGEIKTRNRRYQNTEEAILDALMKTRELPNTGTLARRAHISRTTLYRHHKTVPGIIPDYEKEVLLRYEGVVRKLIRRKNTQVRTICLRTLFFIMAERRAFRILFKYGGGAVVERMILKLKNKLKYYCRLPTNPDRMFKLYTKEVVGVIEEWGTHDFREDEIEKVLGKLLYLTETMRQRLGPVNY